MSERTNGVAAPGATEINQEWSKELAETVRNYDPEWIKYANEGLIVDLHCHRERYKISLSADDLGIVGATPEETKEMQRLVAPTPVYLLPKDAISKGGLEDDRARRTFERHAYRTMWGWWLHKRAYAAWRADIDEIKARYLAVVDEILEHYDQHRADAIVGLTGLVNQTYARLEGTPTAARIKGFENREQWTTDKRDELIARIPGPGQIRASYRMEWEVYRLPLLQEIEQDQVAAGRIRLGAAEQLMLADIEATAKARIQDGIDGFMETVKGQVQTQLCKVADDCLAILQKYDGKLGRNSIVQIQNLIKTNREIVFWEDGTLESRMRALQAIIDTPSEKRDADQLRDTLKLIGAEARLTLLDLGQPLPRSAARVGIPDDLDELVEIKRRGSARTAVDLIGDLDDLGDLPAVRGGTARQAIEAGAL